jgi:hypothetical protein
MTDMSRSKSKKAGHEPDALVHVLQGLRFSGAAGKHADRRTKRARTRAASKARAMKEQG